MNQQPTENEIKKLLENLSYPSQADIMQQQVFYIQTETIRQQRINDERIVEALMNIVANNPSSSARKEAIKTLKYLGDTPPLNPNMNRSVLENSYQARAFLWIFTFLLGGLSIYYIFEILAYQRDDDPGWYWFLPLVLIALWLAMNSGSFPSVGFALFFLGLLFVILTGGPLLYPWGYPLISPVVTATIGGVLGSILGSQKDKNKLIWEIGLALIGIILGGGIGYFNAVLHAG